MKGRDRQRGDEKKRARQKFAGGYRKGKLGLPETQKHKSGGKEEENEVRKRRGREKKSPRKL